MQEVITMHEKFLKCTCKSRLTESSHGKSKFALKTGNGKGMPSGFSHFYCHRVVVSTQKNFKAFFTIGGRLGKVQPLKILLAARPKSGPLAAHAISTR